VEIFHQLIETLALLLATTPEVLLEVLVQVLPAPTRGRIAVGVLDHRSAPRTSGVHDILAHHLLKII
jgi:hypothetical protein